ncbi:uncharacterized protein LOC119901890 isoform X2 [Micropterus salmoides]|uniref:uncharacterized protein LOC119901890 isoform X2 n=1 Tax=Micropterus salmoides TaxID=27706 RepID=UPI0018ECB46F|nr:uncharacterized protein LOC119901890 isoform X2 [Micropterus salmoides]
MLKLVLLFLTLSGLQAVPLALPRRLQRTTYRLPDGFRQGTEPSRRFLVDLNTGLVQEHITEMDRRVAFIQPSLGNGFGEMERRHWLTDKVPLDVPAQKNGGGWIRVEEPSASHIPDGFRQGTEPKISIPDGFRQGTEPKMSIPDGFRQGTEPKMSIPDGFRQGTEPKMSIPDGFRQGTEPIMMLPYGFRQGTEPMRSASDGLRLVVEHVMSMSAGFSQGTEPVRKVPEGFRQGTEPSLHLPEGFRQGTEPSLHLPEGFRQGTEPSLHLPEGFRQGTEPFMSIPDVFRQGTEPILKIPEGFKQGTEPSTSGLQTKTVACKGEVINENCYEFNPTPLAFEDAQVLCRALAPNAELASITSGDLHSRLVSLVTNGGESNPVLTWLGGMVKNQQASWVDGSEWRYSDWMPGHPNIHTDKPVCVEMFKIDESWWTAIDCELKRASICSYPISA